ncbi:MAG: TonB-dependent receptor [Bacteroidia bacterium]
MQRFGFVFRIAYLCFLLIALLPALLLAQENARIRGIILNEKGSPLELVSIMVLETNSGVVSKADGSFVIEVKPAQTFTISFRLLGYQEQQRTVKAKAGEQLSWQITLREMVFNIPDVSVEDRRERTTGLIKIDPKISASLANPSGNFEMILQGMGARSQQELSSQYSVRGGNFDENLVYVNDVEIYRPVMMRSGQQEGMSFINPDLVGSIQFSAGGFEARYGDKMSSVLDVRYRKPEAFRVGVQGSLLGAGLTLEGTDSSKRFTYLIGTRYRTLNYLLGTLDTRGEYFPSAGDAQGLFTFTPNKKWEFSLLANYNQNDFRVIPANRETVFGTVREALQLRVFFDGEEVTSLKSFTGAATATYRPHALLQLKFIGSMYTSDEREYFDIEGAWLLNQLDTELGSENFGKVAFTRGVGAFHNYARNQLAVQVYAFDHRGDWESARFGFVRWGLRAQTEFMADRLFEWRNSDSAGFAFPGWRPGDSVVRLQESIYARNQIAAQRFSGFIQDSWVLNEARNMVLTTGIRFNYWTWNNELLVSPRAEIAMSPRWRRDWVFRAATGMYGQPAFYRELRDQFGQLNPAIRAQRAIHYIAAADYSFKAYDRPFRFVTELYYKDLRRLVPYELDNVRVRYFGDNLARGYATGIDFRINGEFVSTLQSWASLSLMRTRELVDNAFYKDANGNQVPAGYIPRPTDQLAMFNVMFQDLLPSNPTYKVHLNVVYGSRLPFGPPDFDRARDTLRMPPYRRVDIGFSKLIIGEGAKKPGEGWAKHIKSLWINAEVFNLLQVNNTISYLWVLDTEGFLQNIPNYLTGRLINIRLVASF